jgi:hypothetical protein
MCRVSASKLFICYFHIIYTNIFKNKVLLATLEVKMLKKYKKITKNHHTIQKFDTKTFCCLLNFQDENTTKINTKKFSFMIAIENFLFFSKLSCFFLLKPSSTLRLLACFFLLSPFQFLNNAYLFLSF